MLQLFSRQFKAHANQSCASGCDLAPSCGASRNACVTPLARNGPVNRMSVALAPNLKTRLRHHLGVILANVSAAATPPVNAAALRQAIASLSDAVDGPRTGFHALAALALQISSTNGALRAKLEHERKVITAIFAQAHKRELV